MADNELGTALQRNSAYYIHFKQADAKKCPRLTDSQSAQNIIAKHNNIALQNMAMDDYIKKLLEVTKVTEGVKGLFAATAIEEKDLITEIDKNIQGRIQEEFSFKAMQDLYKIWGSYSTKEVASRILNKENLKEAADALSEFLGKIEASLALFEEEGNQDGTLGAVISTIKNNNNLLSQGYQQVGGELEKQVEAYIKRNNNKGVKAESLKKIAGFLMNLGYVFKNEKFKSSGSALTPQGLGILISNNLISTGMGESLGFIATQKIVEGTGDIVRNTLTNVKVGGSAQVTSANSSKITQKVDAAASNVKITAEMVNSNLDFSLNMTIGFSSKFYANQGFKDISDTTSSQMEAGSGGPFKDAISRIWKSDHEKYVVYNYITHALEEDKIKGTILRNDFMRLWSSAGRKDFAQYILVNGYLISIWEVIKYLFAVDDGGEVKGFTLDLPNLEAARKENKKLGQKESLQLGWLRSTRVNNALNAITISSTMHLDQLVNALKDAKGTIKT